MSEVFVMKFVSQIIFAFTLVTSQLVAMDFNQSSFDNNLKDGKVVLLEFYKDGCSTCKAQAPTLNKLTEKYGLSKYKINFKKQKDLVGKFNVSQQSTIIMFVDGKEVNRTIGQTSPDALESQVKEALGMKG